jgi:hypothetical protein
VEIPLRGAIPGAYERRAHLKQVHERPADLRTGAGERGLRRGVPKCVPFLEDAPDHGDAVRHILGPTARQATRLARRNRLANLCVNTHVATQGSFAPAERVQPEPVAAERVLAERGEVLVHAPATRRASGILRGRDAAGSQDPRPRCRPAADPSLYSAGATGALTRPAQVHPAAKALRKHPKSCTVRVGGVVDPSQFAYESPAAKRLRKQPKSWTFRSGWAVEPSQFA